MLRRDEANYSIEGLLSADGCGREAGVRGASLVVVLGINWRGRVRSVG